MTAWPSVIERGTVMGVFNSTRRAIIYIIIKNKIKNWGGGGGGGGYCDVHTRDKTGNS